MYISKVVVKNFRLFDIEGITACFKKGVNAVISENNCGKTALIDAIRIAFSAVPYRKDIYFNLSDFHVDKYGNRCNEAQIDIYLDEVPPDFFEIWDPEDTTKGEFHVKYFIVQATGGKEKVRYSIWGGPVEGNPISAETFEAIQLVFLGALRDAETELRPNRVSKLASLLNTIASTTEVKNTLVNILSDANTNLLKQPPIKHVEEIINSNLSTIEQDVMQQKISLGLVPPRFESIAASLRIWLKPRWFYIATADSQYQPLKESFTPEEWKKYTEDDENGVYLDPHGLIALNKTVPTEVQTVLSTLCNKSLDLFQNGLGYNNILFMAAVLGDMSSASEDTMYKLLLVEEPEAHLHPQLQELVHSFFEKNANNESIQVIYTSHSPTLVSRIGIDKVVLLYEDNHRINCLSLSQSSLDDIDKYKLERYLDVTKSQMLFAKGIIFVEGICEAILIPIMASLINRPFDRYGIEVVNIDGVSFKPFANLLRYAQTTETTIRASIITDDDRCSNKTDLNNYIPKDLDYDTDRITEVIDKLRTSILSDRFNGIKELCEGSRISVFGAPKTFEYALSLEENNIPYILEAILATYPQSGASLTKQIQGLDSTSKKAACIWLYMQCRSKSKGDVAQALARRLTEELAHIPKPGEEPKVTQFVVPEYIKEAIFSVTK